MKTIPLPELRECLGEIGQLAQHVPQHEVSTVRDLAESSRLHEKTDVLGNRSDIQVVVSGGPENAAGFVTKQDPDSMYLDISTLEQSIQFIRYVDFHERLHQKTHLETINIKANCSPTQVEILENNFTVCKNEVDMMEGAIDAHTADQINGGVVMSGYTKEVRAMRKLDAKISKLFGSSVIKLFVKNRHQEMYEVFQKYASYLMLETYLPVLQNPQFTQDVLQAYLQQSENLKDTPSVKKYIRQYDEKCEAEQQRTALEDLYYGLKRAA